LAFQEKAPVIAWYLCNSFDHQRKTQQDVA